VAEDNYSTFKCQEQFRGRPGIRENIRSKKAAYQGAFIEREAAIALCSEIILLRDNFNLVKDFN